MNKNQLKTAVFLITTTETQIGSGVPLNVRREIYKKKVTNLTAGPDTLTLSKVEQDAGLLIVDAAAAQKNITVTSVAGLSAGQIVYLGDVADGEETNTIASINIATKVITMVNVLANTYHIANGAIMEVVLDYDVFTLQNEVDVEPENLQEDDLPLYIIEGGGSVGSNAVPTSYLAAHMVSGTSYLTIWYIDNEE